ncbi:hypothetical protein CRE_28988 [Caenorhabditis remanei]|uniref:F-box domain-containing protein n=1 Tax=Caenorhabditis remanei TaxID=31234 RepID=E3N5D3_CAERE|nr:hypothetical protein CRE_28988 [Caenorhabditis remanei]
MTTAFPLLRLPYLVLMPVLEQMEFLDRIALSILSKRVRMFLKLLKMKCEYINLILKDNTIEMKVLFDNRKELKVDISMIGYHQGLKFTISYHALKPEELRDIIRGNFDSVTVRKYSADFMPNRDMKFSLNDLMMTNVRSLELAGPAFKVEDLNRYFKLWMKKKCNPRLEYLQVATRMWERREELNLLLKGLKVGLVCSIRTDQTFRVLGNIKQFISEIEGEWLLDSFCIRRVDGRRATVRIGTRGTVCFYVWPESTNNTTHLEPNRSSFMRKFPFISNFYNSCIERFK